MKSLSRKLFEHVEELSSRLRYIENDSIILDTLDGKWSEKEILGHLIDSAINNYRRFLIASTTDNLVFDGYQQELWVTTQDYNGLSWEGIITLWSDLNFHIARMIANIPPEKIVEKRKIHNLDQVGFGNFDNAAPISLGAFIEDYIDHILHHMNQIFMRQEASKKGVNT